MSAQLISLFSEIKNFVPWVSFIAGLGGGLHCVGMCGGLVTASCDKTSDVVRYQIGRLLGYLVLGVFAGSLSQYLSFNASHPLLKLIPAIFIGLIFVYWGLKSFSGKKAEVPVPKVFSRFYHKLWLRLVYKNVGVTKSFFTGLISIMLPCGLLYGVMLGTVAFQNIGMALISVFCFWLGTLPSMVVAPAFINRLIKPLKQRIPKVFAMGLMVIGVLTITVRVMNYHNPMPSLNEQQCH